MKKKIINLALQGGGAHGAFTWGVLDYLLEDGRVAFEGIAATSAGAMNAAALIHGYQEGGPERAREVMENFWNGVADAGVLYGPIRRSPWEQGLLSNPFFRGLEIDESASFAAFDIFTRSISPYHFNPMNINPLRDVLERTINFDKVHDCRDIKLFVTATNVKTGNPKIFENEEVTIDALLASSALPFLFQAVEIKGKHYWDGGYVGNPSLWPLFYRAQARDILLVHVNPIVRDKLPVAANEIQDRMNEITFNSALLKELRAIDFVKKLINEDMLRDEYKSHYKDVLLHAIRADQVLQNFAFSSKFNTDRAFLRNLRDLGRSEAKKWLSRNYRNINKQATVDIRADYLGKD